MSLLRLRARLEDERGVVAVVVAVLMVVLGGSVAMTFDMSRLRHEKHLIQTAVDLGSLAGADLLPVSDAVGAAAAEAVARSVAESNAPQLATLGLTITFACVVSDPEGNGGQDSFDLTFACGPASGTWIGGWTSRGGKAIHDCNPYVGDLCNTIRLRATGSVDFYFAPLIGFNQGSTGAVAAAACKGFCGQGSSPLDVVFVIDRTGSMSPADIANVKDAILDLSAAEDSVLEFYNANEVHIGLMALPYQLSGNPCAVELHQFYPAPVPPPSNQALWQLSGFSSDYRVGGTGAINPASQLVNTLQCMPRAGSNVHSHPPAGGSGNHTNHGDPLMAAQYLLAQGRTEAPDVIIFFADGQANQPTSTGQPCNYANNASAAAKSAGTTVFALGYGVDTTRCNQDTSGPFAGKFGTTFLASVASSTPTGPSTDDSPGGCGVNENLDGDFYFCESRGEDLEDVFRQIVIQSLQRSRLLNF